MNTAPYHLICDNIAEKLESAFKAGELYSKTLEVIVRYYHAPKYRSALLPGIITSLQAVYALRKKAGLDSQINKSINMEDLIHKFSILRNKYLTKQEKINESN